MRSSAPESEEAERARVDLLLGTFPRVSRPLSSGYAPSSDETLVFVSWPRRSRHLPRTSPRSPECQASRPAVSARAGARAPRVLVPPLCSARNADASARLTQKLRAGEGAKRLAPERAARSQQSFKLRRLASSRLCRQRRATRLCPGVSPTSAARRLGIKNEGLLAAPLLFYPELLELGRACFLPLAGLLNHLVGRGGGLRPQSGRG